MSSRPKVYVTRHDIPQGCLELIREKCDVTLWEHDDDPVPKDVLLKNVVGKDAILCLLTDNIDREVIEAAGPSLKVVATLSDGFDHLDVAELRIRGIKIGHTPNVSTDACAELTVALLLSASRRLVEAHQAAAEGHWKPWSPTWLLGRGLRGTTVGVVGFGHIGQGVARILKGFSVSRILYFNKHERAQEAAEIGAAWVTFDELLENCDFIVVCCALTEETRGMFNTAAFAKMKKHAIFVNTSRGDVIDEDALLVALQNGTIFGAGLDVTVPEPLPVDHPLWQQKNCVILPHIASACTETRATMARLTAENILCALEGTEMPGELHH